MHGYDEDKAKVIARLRRIEGQVRAITQMVEDDKYCIDILTQISASNSALKSVALLLLIISTIACGRRRFRAARWPMKNLRRLPRPLRVSSNRDEFYRHSPSMTYWVPCLSK